MTGDARDGKRIQRALAIGCGGCGLLIAVLVGMFVFTNRSHFWPDPYLDDIERASQPVIEALDRYEREHGAPPERLELLVPGYLPQLPYSGFPGQRQFIYDGRPLPDGTHMWRLTVYTSLWLDSNAGFWCSSRTRKWQRNTW